MFQPFERLTRLAILLFLASLPATYFFVQASDLQLPRLLVLVILLSCLYFLLFLAVYKDAYFFRGAVWQTQSARRPRILIWAVSCMLCLSLLVFGALMGGRSKKDNKITITLLQLNDVYEISPLDEGRSGGLARVATLKKELGQQNPLFTILAGDFLSPSAIGTLKDNNNERILGLQMIDVLNAAGLDLATFGNHEFDLDRYQLQKCIDRSAFDWVSSNTGDSVAAAYVRNFSKSSGGSSTAIPVTYIKEFTDADGTKLKIGFFGLTVRSTAGGYVSYKDYDRAASEATSALKGKCDLIIALTHLSLNEDTMIAARHPEISMIIGGHEHVNSHNLVGAVPVVKADANARTVYVHTIEYDKQAGSASISSELKTIDNNIKPDPAVDEVVKKWNNKADSLLRKAYNPCRTIASLPGDFDGTENVRQQPTNLSLAISKSMVAAVKNNPPATALYNSGSIRLDDVLRGNITEYDIFRMLPYDNQVYVATLPGSLLTRLLEVSYANKTDGCFLQYDTSVIKKGKDSIWRFNGQAMTATSKHRIAINWYLLSGRQDKMKFMSEFMGKMNIEPPSLRDTLQIDLRRAVISYLEKTYPPQSQEKQKRIIPCYGDQ